MKTNIITILVNDIREFIAESDPFNYRSNYESDADANTEIADLLHHNPEFIILYLSDMDDADALITRIKVATM